jgi:hypothetical protein
MWAWIAKKIAFALIDTANRIVATVDADGNRSAVTLTP